MSLSLSIDEVNELPAAFDALDADAVAVVIQARIGPLRRSDPKIILLREFLGEDAFELRPKIVFIPVLENAVPGFLRVEAVAEVLGHHSRDRVRIVRRYRLL